RWRRQHARFAAAWKAHHGDAVPVPLWKSTNQTARLPADPLAATRALPLADFGPVLFPPCRWQRPEGSRAARRQGVPVRVVDARPAVREVALELREAMVDDAESQLYAAVLRGEPWAVRFFLLTQAKSRGYSLRAESFSMTDL